VSIGGSTAVPLELSTVLSNKLPLFIAAIVGLSMHPIAQASFVYSTAAAEREGVRCAVERLSRVVWSTIS
jgi:hypothetical protein